MTLDAKKTIALETWEQLGRQVPDAVVCPVGDKSTLSAMANVLNELKSCGATTSIAHVVGVQSEDCQPLRKARETGSPLEPVEPSTTADGTAVGNPVSAGMVLRNVERSDRAFVAVSDDDLQAAMSNLASRGGVLAAPTGAAAFAGVERALKARLIFQDGRIVVLVTGTATKNLRHVRPTTRAISVSGDLAAVEPHMR